MSSNNPPGYGYPTDPQQNPYGQQPPAPGYGTPPPYGQAGYGTAPGAPGYGPPPAGQQAWPLWLTPPGQYSGPPAPGTRILASAGDRFLARLIDTAVLLIPIIVVTSILGASVIGDVFAGLVIFGYEAAMLLTQHGQTVGKKVMKLRVVDVASGGRPADNAFWIRAAVYGLPGAVYCLGSLFQLLNCLWLLWDKPLQQCLHDKGAKTLVVKEG
ncbi:RDD family protein [Kitasatospora sp. NPDC059571]|uniref:RDD family protein n=1 Tax=Kitasatospora sp. NPDC059571 TaxID=3346871 RepID=UPI0036A52330